jgi:hypothetical protein
MVPQIYYLFKIAGENWQKYAWEQNVDMVSHLLPSPFKFDEMTSEGRWHAGTNPTFGG